MLNKSDLVSKLSRRLQCTLTEAATAYDALVDDLSTELRVAGTVTLPGVAKLVIKKIPARPACKKVIAGKEYDLSAKPASKAVRARLLKVFVDKVQ